MIWSAVGASRGEFPFLTHIIVEPQRDENVTDTNIKRNLSSITTSSGQLLKLTQKGEASAKAG